MPIDRRASVRSAAIVGVSSLAGACVPVLPFALLGLRAGVIAALVLGAALLFALGTYKASVTSGGRLRSGTELALIGMASAVAGYVIGYALAPGQ